jgi:predicted branched-subunit amino acid permease
VTFLGAVGGNTIAGVDILYMGLAIAAVIVALTLQRWLERKSKDET